MDKEIEKACEEQIVALTSMYRQQQLDSNTYYKCIVSIAYEYAVGEQLMKAASMVQAIPLDYYKTVQKGQMTEDPNFAYISYTLALTLFQAGLISYGPQITPTMPVASA